MCTRSVDAERAVWHATGMFVARHIGLLVLLLALLPWGALTGARMAPWAEGRVAWAVTEALAGTEAEALAEVPKLQDIRAVKQCRTGLLPGGCGPEAGLQTAFGFEPPLLRRVAGGPGGPDLRRGIGPGPGSDPPRAV